MDSFSIFLLCYSTFKISSTFPGFLVLPQSRITFGVSRKMNKTYSRNKLCLYIISCSQFHLFHHYNSFSLIFRVEFYVSHSYTLFLGDFGTRTLSRVVNRIFRNILEGKGLLQWFVWLLLWWTIFFWKSFCLES